MLWICIAAPAQLIVVSTVGPGCRFLVRSQGIAQYAGIKASLVVLAGAVGSIIWGAVVDRVGRRPGISCARSRCCAWPRCW
jgi:MFS family permease